MKHTVLIRAHPKWNFRLDFYEDDSVELAWIDPAEGITLSAYIAKDDWRINLFSSTDNGIVVIGAPWAFV